MIAEGGGLCSLDVAQPNQVVEGELAEGRAAGTTLPLQPVLCGHLGDERLGDCGCRGVGAPLVKAIFRDATSATRPAARRVALKPSRPDPALHLLTCVAELGLLAAAAKPVNDQSISTDFAYVQPDKPSDHLTKRY